MSISAESQSRRFPQLGQSLRPQGIGIVMPSLLRR
jgi:hypothetical protein